jgi:predicted AAA+ superfamily ATPase
LADSFEKLGGSYLFIDEVHKYPNWLQEIKNIYDTFPQLKTVFTGSSLLEILNSRAD